MLTSSIRVLISIGSSRLPGAGEPATGEAVVGAVGEGTDMSGAKASQIVCDRAVCERCRVGKLLTIPNAFAPESRQFCKPELERWISAVAWNGRGALETAWGAAHDGSVQGAVGKAGKGRARNGGYKGVGGNHAQ